MKKTGIIFFALLLLMSCGDQDFPYPGYLHVKPMYVEAAGGNMTVPIETDRSNITLAINEEDAQWCSYTVNGSNVNLTLAANAGEARSATIKVRAGNIDKNLGVYQWGPGVNEVKLVNSGWTATCSDEQASDGGGVNSIFTEVQTTYWHSEYGHDLPHWILVDLKDEYPLVKIRLGYRQYGSNYSGDTRVWSVSLSKDGQNFTEVASVDKGPVSATYAPTNPAYNDATFPSTTARYVKIEITQSNRGTNANVAAFIPFIGN